MKTSTLAYSVPEACAIARCGRTTLYQAIRSGALRAVKRGRRTLILPDDLRRFVESHPPVAVKNTPQSEPPAHAGPIEPLREGDLSTVTPLRDGQNLGAQQPQHGS
jgi:excisionase family DNA binding protein